MGVLFDLHDQLAGRRNDQGAGFAGMTFDGKRIAQQVIDNGNQKRRGFTRACLGSADRICTSQSMMKHLRLNRRAVLKAGLGNAAHQAQIDPVLTLPLLEISGVEIDTIARQVGIEQLLLDGLAVDVRLRDDGLHLEQLFTPVAAQQEDASDQAVQQEVTSEPPTLSDEETIEEASPWQILLARFELSDASITVIDETLTVPATLVVTPINLVVEQVAFNRDEKFTIKGDITVAESGQLQLSGEGSIEPLVIVLRTEITAFPLTAVQGWIQDSAALNLSDGELNASLIIEAENSVATEQVDTRVTGQLAISGLNLQEANGDPLLGFSSLTADGIALSLLNSRLDIDTVTLVDLRAQSLIDAGGSDVAMRIAVPDSAGDETSVSAAEEAAPWQFAIDQGTGA